MKKFKLKALLKLREMCNEVLGEKETEKIINNTVKEVLEETKPKKKRILKKGDK